MESNSSNAACLDIVCLKGDTFLRELIFWEDKYKTIPVDITGFTFKMQVRKGRLCTVILSFDMSDGIAITPTNKLTLSKTALEMSSLPVGTFDYDIERTSGSVVTTFIKGSFIIQQDYSI